MIKIPPTPSRNNSKLIAKKFNAQSLLRYSDAIVFFFFRHHSNILTRIPLWVPYIFFFFFSLMMLINLYRKVNQKEFFFLYFLLRIYHTWVPKTGGVYTVNFLSQIYKSNLYRFFFIKLIYGHESYLNSLYSNVELFIKNI